MTERADGTPADPADRPLVLVDVRPSACGYQALLWALAEAERRDATLLALTVWSGDPAQPEAGEEGGDPNVVASGLDVPTGLVVLTDGSAIVGERETGRLLQVFPDGSPARELMTVPGVDTTGDGGLLGLALSPTYVEDGLLYAYLSTATDNRVVRFPLGGTPNPVLTGIPRGERGNGGGLWFSPNGTLYVGTGDTGRPELAADPGSLAGKVLHVDVFGRAVGRNRIFSSGHRDVAALCSTGSEDAPLFAAGDGELNSVTRNSEHGWPDEGPDVHLRRHDHRRLP